MVSRKETKDSTLFSVAGQAEAGLQASPYSSIRKIVCIYDEGILVLRGRVPTFYHKQTAQIVVAGIEGIKQIVNQIEVPDPAT
jgi:osmotically-inducible protein OsmY